MVVHQHPSSLARAMWAAAEPFTLYGLASPEMFEAMTGLGIHKRGVFLAARGAVLGEAGSATVAAAFHAFPRSQFEEFLSPIWAFTSPAEVIATHHATIPVMALRVLPRETNQADLHSLANQLGIVIGNLDVSGRPLASGNQAIELPAEPWAKFWRAWSTLREYRGDAHIAVLISHNLTVAEVQVLSTTWGEANYDVKMLRKTRNMTDEIWSSAQVRLAARGLLRVDGSLTPEGQELRENIEIQTDEACMNAWNQLSVAELNYLYDFTFALSEAVVSSGAFPAQTAVGSPWPPPSSPVLE